MDRRRSPRFYVNQAVVVGLLKNDTCMEGRIQDISQNGVGILVPAPVFAGDVVEVRSKQLTLLAEVRHARECEGGYALGLEFCHEILKSEIESVRTQKPVPPVPSLSYLSKLGPVKPAGPGEKE